MYKTTAGHTIAGIVSWLPGQRLSPREIPDGYLQDLLDNGVLIDEDSESLDSNSDKELYEAPLPFQEATLEESLSDKVELVSEEPEASPATETTLVAKSPWENKLSTEVLEIGPITPLDAELLSKEDTHV